MLADDFAAAARIETVLQAIEETTEAARATEKAMEKDRRNRRFFGLGPLRKEILSQIGDSRYQRDCHYESAKQYREELKGLRARIAEQETAEANVKSTAAMVEGLSLAGSAAAISVRKPLRFRPPGIAEGV